MPLFPTVSPSDFRSFTQSVVVAAARGVNVDADVAPATVLLPAGDSGDGTTTIYRVSAHAETYTAGSAGSVLVRLTYNNGAGNKTFEVLDSTGAPVDLTNVDSRASATFVLVLKAATALTYQVDFDSVAGGATGTWAVTVEKLT